MKIKIFNLLSFIIILTFIFVGCEKEFDNVVESSNPDYQVTEIILKDSLEYPIDNSQRIHIKFNFTTYIKNVQYDIYSPDNRKLNNTQISLLDNGLGLNGDSIASDGMYSSIVPFDSTNMSGIYLIKFYVLDTYDKIKEVGISYFFFDNGQGYFAPIISNLVLIDSINRGTSFTFSVDVSDSNGLGDVTKVIYELFRPDGSQVVNSQGIKEFPLFDNGDTALNGDISADDGRFTTRLTFPASVSTGLWRFEFSAIDRKIKISNRIIKSVKVL